MNESTTRATSFIHFFGKKRYLSTISPLLSLYAEGIRIIVDSLIHIIIRISKENFHQVVRDNCVSERLINVNGKFEYQMLEALKV